MERDWERRHEIPELPDDLVQAAVRAHAGGTIARTEALPGGKINAHLRLVLDSGDSLVLRVGLGEAEALSKEAALLRHFAGAIPLPALKGEGHLDLPGGPRPYLLLSWVPGESLDEVLVPRAGGAREETTLERAGLETGAAMARVHAERRPRLGFFDETLRVAEAMGPLAEVCADYVDSLRAKPAIAARLGRQRSEALQAVLRKEPALLKALDGDFRLLHGDCKPTNVRVSAEGQLTGVLDWEFAWAGPRLFDWGQMLRWSPPPAYVTALRRGYEESGGGDILAGDGRRQAALLDLMNLVSFLDWSDGSERPRRVRDALQLIDATLAGS